MYVRVHTHCCVNSAKRKEKNEGEGWLERFSMHADKKTKPQRKYIFIIDTHKCTL
jgi:hypothetical protein